VCAIKLENYKLNSYGVGDMRVKELHGLCEGGLGIKDIGKFNVALLSK